MPVHILEQNFPVPIPADARLKSVGMNLEHMVPSDDPIQKELAMYPGIRPVQNVGAEEGYAAVVTDGLSNCVAVGLIESNRTTGKITRISMVHLHSSLDILQLDALSDEMLKNFKPQSHDHERQIIVFPGFTYSNLEKWTSDIFHPECKKTIGRLFDVEPRNIVSTMQGIHARGNHSACISFDGFAGHMDHYPLETALIKADIVPKKSWKRPPIPSSIETRFSRMTSKEYKEAFSKYPISGRATIIIENSSQDDEVKLKLYYLVHRQVAAIKAGDNHYAVEFKQKLARLRVISPTQSLILGLFSEGILGLPVIRMLLYCCQTVRANGLDERGLYELSIESDPDRWRLRP